MIKQHFLFSLSLLSLALYSCTNIDAYEKSEPIRNHQWSSVKSIEGDVDITDTTSVYKSSLVLRHTDAYAYNNMWIDFGWQAPGDSIMVYKKLNLLLGNDAVGWFGTGFDDIWEVRIPLEPKPKELFKKGKYHYSVKQIMREDPLQEVMSVGFRLEKADHQ